MTTIDIAAFRSRTGEEFVSDWRTVTQKDIDTFADATGDHQWIHVDAQRAAVETPFKSTIAHGFLTLSLVSTLIRSAAQFANLRMAINYGSNRVRFVSPVPAGSRIRGRFTVGAVEDVDVPGGGVQVTWNAVVEREGGDKPALVAEWLVRYYT
ncbi:MAG TPA: MaoC family dehydratase [Vicinamibacterales bacterium]|nr:MaoC family dehydratase [Vicinamibacterales bacterium]